MRVSGFDAKNQMTKTSNASFSVSVSLLILALIKEIKTAVTDKHHFVDRDESFLIKTFWKFRTIKFVMEGKILLNFQSDPPQKQYNLPNEVLIDNLRL